MKSRHSVSFWLHLLPLDMVLSVLIIAALMGWALTQWPLMMGKARMTEILVQAGTTRMAVVERFALEGTLRQPMGKPEHVLEPGARKYTYELDGSRLVVRGTLHTNAEPFFLTFTPEVDSSGAGWSVRWRCGENRAALAALSAENKITHRETHLTTNLTSDQLPFMCRHQPSR